MTQTEITPAPPASLCPSVPQCLSASVPCPPLSPRQAILHKLSERLESGFGKTIKPLDTVDSLRNTRYLILVVAKHFGMSNFAAQDLVIVSKTISELAGKIADLQHLPPENLF